MIRRALGRLGLAFAVVAIRVAGAPVVRLDAVAFGEVRDRQRVLSAGADSGPFRLEELRRRARLEPLILSSRGERAKTRRSLERERRSVRWSSA